MSTDARLDGGSLAEADVLARISAAIHKVSGYPAAKVTKATRLVEDAGITGDDGQDLIVALNARFPVDWTGFDVGLHFGNEGLGVPLPWQLASNCVMFERVTLTVGQIVDAVRLGRWAATPRVPVSAGRRVWLYLPSWGQLVLVIVVIAAIVFAMVRRSRGS